MKIFSTAPSRISLAGGGTDFAPYASMYGGMVVSFTINLRQELILYTADDMWSIAKHEFPSEADPTLFYEILSEYGLGGMHLSKVRSSFDGFIGCGLGSSASSAVALIGACLREKGKTLERSEIAKKAYEIEVIKLGWYGGAQDQYASAIGGGNILEFGAEVRATPLSHFRMDQLRPYLILTYIGQRKTPQRVHARAMFELPVERIVYLHKLKSIARKMSDAISEGEFSYVGVLLDINWKLKRQLHPLSTTKHIDELYEKALQAGALGGKVLGSGSGGYMLFIVLPTKRGGFMDFLKKYHLEEVDFSYDYNGLETRIL